MSDKSAHIAIEQSGSQPASPTGKKPVGRKSCLGRIARFLGILMLFMVFIVALAATPFGRNRIVGLVVNSIPLTDGYLLQFDRTSGSLLAGLTLYNLRLSDAEDQTLAGIDTATVDLNFVPLLSRTISIRYLDIRNPTLKVTQLPSGTWDIVDAFLVDTTSAGGGFATRIESASIRNGSVTAAYDSASVDSMFAATDIVIIASDVALGDELGFDLQELHGSFVPPGLAEPAYLRAVGLLSHGVIQIDTLIVSSPRTNLHAVGGATILSDHGDSTLALWDRLAGVRLSLSAQPVAFTDLAPFLPTVDASAHGTIQAQVTGSARDAQFGLNADFGPHGSIEATGHAAMNDGEPVELQIDATFESLRASLFDGSRFKKTDIVDGTLSANLVGPTVNQLDGDVQFSFRDTNVGAIRLSEPNLRATFVAGMARYTGTVRLAGQSVTAQGTARLFDDTPTYDAAVSLKAFDVSKLGPSLSKWPTSLTGAVNINGSQFASPTLRMAIDLDGSRINQLNVVDAIGVFTVSGDVISGDMSLKSRRGSASARARINSLQSSAWTLDEVTATNLDVAALLGDTTKLVITGSSKATGFGWDAQTLRFSGDVRIDSAFVSTIRISDLDLSARKLEKTISFTETGLVDSVRVTARGDVTFASVPRLRILDGEISNLNIGKYVAGQSSDLNGSLEGTLAGTDLKTMTGSLVARLSKSTLNKTPVNGGTITAQIVNGAVDFEVDVVTTSGRLTLAGLIDAFGETPSYQLHRSTLFGVNFGALLGIPSLSTSLNGTVAGSITGTSLKTLRGVTEITISESAINGIDGVVGTVRLDATDSMTTASANLRWADGLVTGFVRRSPGMNGDTDRRHEAAVTIEHLDIGRWFGMDSVSTDISAELTGTFTGTTLSTINGGGQLVRLTGHYQGLEIAEGSGGFTIDHGTLVINRAIINSNAGTLLANGTVALIDRVGATESNLSLDANIKTLRPIGELIPRLRTIGGSGRLLAQITGPSDLLAATAELKLNSVEYKDRRILSIDSKLEALFDGNRRLSMFDASADLLNLILPTTTIRETTLHAALVDSVFQFEGISAIDDRRSVQLSGILDPRAQAKSVLVDHLSIRLDNDRWKLLQPSAITYGDGIRVKNLLLFTDDQQIALDGVINVNGEQSLILTVENFRIGSVADLLDFRGLAGTANGYLDLSGPADAPIVEGDLSFDVISDRNPVGDMQLSLRYDSLLLYPDARFRHVDGSTLNITGKLPIDLRLAESRGPTQTGVRVAARQATPDTQVDLQIDADSFSMGWMLPFLDKEFYDKLDGKFDGTVNVSGTVRNPALSGFATVVNGRIGLPTFGIAPDRITADLEFDGNEIRILRGTGKSGSGKIVATGQINLSELSLGEFDISLSMENFLAMDNIQFRGAKTSGDLLLYGTTRAPTVSGYLLMDALDIYYTGAIEEFEPVILSEADLREVEETFGRRVSKKDTMTFSFYEALQIDINLEMERDTWLRSKQNPRMNIEFAGDMDLQKNPNEDERMFGTINVLPERSTIDQFGRRFEIQSGTVTYNGDFDNPIVDIAAKYTVKSPTDRNSEVEITLKATGSMQNLEIQLNSDPQMELTDILSYILTGRPAAQTLQFSGGETGLATDIALSQATGYLEGLAGSELGLDVVRIENDGSEIKLTAGKYIRKGVYLAISQPVVLSSSASGSSSGENNRPEFTVEVEIIRDLLARLLQQGSGFKLTLFWKHAY